MVKKPVQPVAISEPEYHVGDEDSLGRKYAKSQFARPSTPEAEKYRKSFQPLDIDDDGAEVELPMNMPPDMIANRFGLGIYSWYVGIFPYLSDPLTTSSSTIIYLG